MKFESFLITGGCGFIGTALISKLLSINPNAHIRILDSLVTGTLNDLRAVTTFECVSENILKTDKGVSLVVGDVRNARLVDVCVEGVECIFHFAANTGVGPSVVNPQIDMECNVIGTFNVLEAARKHGVKKFIFSSSGAPIGEVIPPIHEEIAPHPVSPYGASKLAGEGYCSAYFNSYGLDTVCLRFGNVYGPGSSKKESVVAKFVKLALAGEICVIYGDGNQTRDFIYIDDLVNAVLRATDVPGGGEIFQIASGREQTVLEVASIIRDSFQLHGINMCIEHQSVRLGDVLRNFSDTSKAYRLLGWRAQISIEAGILNTVNWYLSFNRGLLQI